MPTKTPLVFGVDDLHPRVPLDLSDECCSKILTPLHKVEMATIWPTPASTTLFLLISRSTTSERPTTLLRTPVRWLEWPGTSLLGMFSPSTLAAQRERGDRPCWSWRHWTLKGGQISEGATTLVVDLAKAFEKVHLAVAWSWAMYYGFRQSVHTVLCGYFAHERRTGAFDATITVTAILSRSTGSVLLLRIVKQDATGSVFDVLLELKNRVDADDMKLFMKGISIDLSEGTRNFHDLLKVEIQKVHLELSVTKGGKEGKRTLEVS